jgi:acetyl esterase
MPHSELLVEKLRAQGVKPEMLFYPVGYEPPLDHDYQFDLDIDAGQLFLERMLALL